MGARGWLADRSAALPPAVFSIVMATGIVSTATELLGLAPVAWALFGINCFAYSALALLTLVRLARTPERIRDDFRTHGTAPGFFTTVAGTCVLGSEFVLLVGRPEIALILWLLGILLWFLLVYAFFTFMTVRESKPRLEEGMNGGWMLLVVGTQGVSLLGTLLAPATARSLVLGFTTALYLLGCLFYIVLFSLILYRFLFFPFDPVHLTPPYWINMGAVAITTLSGALLTLRAPVWPFLEEIRPFLKAFTLLFWTTATWWIPLLLVLGAWRHGVRRVPLRYDLQYWSMVFPLGMYSVATIRLAEALGWTALRPVGYTFGYVALVAWGVAGAGLLRSTR